MTVTLTASTGAKILVWREKDMFAALRAGGTEEAQICLGIDLFEVIAELAGLDLDDEDAVRGGHAARRPTRGIGWPRCRASAGP